MPFAESRRSAPTAAHQRLKDIDALIGKAEQLIRDQRERMREWGERGWDVRGPTKLLSNFADSLVLLLELRAEVIDDLHREALDAPGPESAEPFAPPPRLEPHLETASRALDVALAAMPLGAIGAATGEMKSEYAALLLYVLHTKERLDVLRARWGDRPAGATPPPSRPPG